MQMSLEAITMLMRFQRRSCCSSIRGYISSIFGKQLCAQNRGHTFLMFSILRCPLQLGPQPPWIWSALEGRSFYFWNSRLQRFIAVLLFLAALSCLSITSKLLFFFINITVELPAQIFYMLPHVSHKKGQMSVTVHTQAAAASNTTLLSRSAVKQDKTCSGSSRTGAAIGAFRCKTCSTAARMCSLCATAGRHGDRVRYHSNTEREPSRSRLSICVLTHFHSHPQVFCLPHLAVLQLKAASPSSSLKLPPHLTGSQGLKHSANVHIRTSNAVNSQGAFGFLFTSLTLNSLHQALNINTLKYAVKKLQIKNIFHELNGSVNIQLPSHPGKSCRLVSERHFLTPLASSTIPQGSLWCLCESQRAFK